MLRSVARAVLLSGFTAASISAQSPVDGLMMPKRTMMAGVMYAHDSWREYWEGTLKRTNGNIGTVTTHSVAFAAGYAITDRIAIMAALPYVSTHASQGVLSDMRGIQDLSVSAKYRFASVNTQKHGALSAFIVGAAAVPVSDYTPDFLPLSIGTGGSRAAGRLILNYQSATSWFATASAAYTFCNNVKLNRNSYYTDGQLYLTNEVSMPNVFESSISAGYKRGRIHIPLSLTNQRTLGGGDIRRQDMPFVSNRMDFTRVDATVAYALPRNLSVRIGAGHVLSGRNVGQSTTFTSGLFYAHRL